MDGVMECAMFVVVFFACVYMMSKIDGFINSHTDEELRGYRDDINLFYDKRI